MKALAALAAACAGRERKVLLLVYAGFAAMAMLAAATDVPQRGEAAFGLLALPTIFIWAGWFARVLLLQRHARGELSPAADSMAAGAVGAATIVTVVLPALLVSALGMPVTTALAGFAGAAALGSLLVLLPRGMGPLVGFAPMALATFDGGSLFRSLHLDVAWPALAGLAVLAAAWCWIVLLRNGDATRSSWSQPLLFATGMREIFWGPGLRGRQERQLAARPRWMQRGDSLGKVGPDRPVAAMRLWLGRPFAPSSPVQWFAQAACWLVSCALLWRWAKGGRHPFENASVIQSLLLLFGASATLATYAIRLQAFKQAHAAEMAELALLPGWGGNDAARRWLLMAIAVPMALFAGLVSVASFAVGMSLHDDALRLALVLVASVSTWLLAAALCVRVLGGTVVEPLAKWLAILAGIMLFGTATIAFDIDRSPTWTIAAIVEWALLAMLATIALRSAWTRFRAMPHAFIAHLA